MEGLHPLNINVYDIYDHHGDYYMPHSPNGVHLVRPKYESPNPLPTSQCPLRGSLLRSPPSHRSIIYHECRYLP